MIRALFFEELHAQATAERLVSDGFVAEVVVERLAGEDDDLDHRRGAVTAAEIEIELELERERDAGWHEHAAGPGGGPLLE